MSANQKKIYMAKVIFLYRDFVAGTKSGGIPVCVIKAALK